MAMDEYHRNRVGVVGHVDGEDELYKMSGEQVRTLARLVHLQEAQNARTMTFRSSNHRVQYLRDSRNTYESALGILDSMQDTKSVRHQEDEEHSKAEQYLYDAAALLVGSACRTEWSLHLRDKYLKSIREFALEKKNVMNDIRNNTELTLEDKLVKYQELVIEVSNHKQLSLDAMKSRQNPTSRNFSKLARKLMYDYPDNMFLSAVTKYRRAIRDRREMESEIEGIDPEETVELWPDNAEVYEEILARTGIPSHANLVKVARGASRALIVFQLGMMVWDVVESKHRVRTAAKDATTFVVTLGAGIAGEMAGTWFITGALATLGVATTTIVGSGIVFAASFATGVGFALLAGWLVGEAFAKLFHSQDKVVTQNIAHHPTTEHPVVHVVPPHPSAEKYMVHYAPHVDGERLARQLTAASSYHG